MTYMDAIDHVGFKLKDFYGYDGEKSRTEAAIIDALKEGWLYQGGWFIPPISILENLIYPNINTGALKDTFVRNPSDLWGKQYWSSTVGHQLTATSCNMSHHARHDYHLLNVRKLSTRVVRVEPA